MRITGYDHLTDFNRILRAALERGPVLVCYLDGLGWHMYKHAVKNDKMPYTEDHFMMLKMETVSPPLTNPAMATMLTGELPPVHGVVSRKEHRTAVPTIFADCRRPAAVIEGDSVIIRTEVRQRLNISCEERSVDEAVFDSAMEAVAEGKEFLFVHFHGIDDAGHTFGPYAAATMNRIRKVDRYLEQLCASWQGEVFLISDHGLHSVSESGASGSHGEELPGQIPGD